LIASFTHFPANDVISFFFIYEKYSVMYIYRIVFIHVSVDGHLHYCDYCSNKHGM
jgi:hypothetical protein